MGNPIILDFTKAQPVNPPDPGVTLDFSKAQPLGPQMPPRVSAWRSDPYASFLGAANRLLKTPVASYVVGGKTISDIIEPYLPSRERGGVAGAIGDIDRLVAGLADFAGSPEGFANAFLAVATGGASTPFQAAGYAAASGSQIPELAQRYYHERTPENLQNLLTAGAFTAGLGAAAGRAAPGMKAGFEAGKAHFAELKGALPSVRMSPQSAAFKGYNLTLKSVGYGQGDFRADMKTAADAGHLREFATQYHPKTVYEAARNIQDYMNNWEETTTGAAIARHPDAQVLGDYIADRLQSFEDPEMARFFPQESEALRSEGMRYKGKEIPLETVRGLLAKVNAMSRSLMEMNPADKAAVEKAQAAKGALDKVGGTLRDSLYGSLEDLGEQGIRQARKEYGALASFRDQIYDAIPKAEEAEAKKPSYWSVPGRSVTRHPLLTGGVVTAGFIHPAAAPALTVLPAIEAARTFGERAGTPNALLQRALDAYRQGPEGIKRPSYQPPAPPAEGPLPPPPGPTPPVVPPTSSPVLPQNTPPIPPATAALAVEPAVPAAETPAPAPEPPSALRTALKTRQNAGLVLNYLKNPDKFSPASEAKAVGFVQRELGIDISGGENIVEAEAGLKLLAAGKKPAAGRGPDKPLRDPAPRSPASSPSHCRSWVYSTCWRGPGAPPCDCCAPRGTNKRETRRSRRKGERSGSVCGRTARMV